MISQPRIVLINTSHPGNIGAAARAMKTMGFSELYLVSPRQFPHVKANEMASNALDVLAKARVVKSLGEAIDDCHLIVGTSARSRSLPWPLMTPRLFAEEIKKKDANTKVAILFGTEQSGLTNEELHKCHFHIHIPANPEYSSLNLAAAVQIIVYELHCAIHSFRENEIHSDSPLANHQEVENFYQHLERTLITIGFLNPATPKALMARLRRMYNRAQLEKVEINILRGILTEAEKKHG